MFPYVFIALLVINFILLLIVLLKGSKQKDHAIPEPFFEKSIHDEKQILREMNELRRSIKRLSTDYRQDIQQMREEVQTLFEKAKQELKTEKVENLLITERYKEVFELRDKGLSDEQIAKELGKGCGEVSFILQLGRGK